MQKVESNINKFFSIFGLLQDVVVVLAFERERQLIDKKRTA